VPEVSDLRIPEPVASISLVWPSEPRDFTPWLGQHLEVLDILGLGRLELLETEKSVPGTLRALDILARQPTGELVAIENQFGKLNHDHLTRGLAYVVGLRVPTLVLVSEEHVNEFRAVAAYLNSLAERSQLEERIGVYLVDVSVERVQKFYVPRFVVTESPNPWTEAVAQTTPTQPLESLEAFLQQLPTEIRQPVADLLQWWRTGVGTIRLGAKNVSLDRPHPVKGRPLSHFVVYSNSAYWLNCGYLLDAGVIPPDRSEEFDTLVESVLPDLKMGEKRYYMATNGPPPRSGIQRVVEWRDKAEISTTG
jgi:hypothetical protein